MDTLNDTHCKGLALDHLGLIADKIHELQVVDLINERLPLDSKSGVKTTMGERVAAMILNGLGFIDTRLYLFPEFLEKKPVERLFGKALQPEWFNDDSLGRCLDAIAAYGTTKLFTEISFHIGKKKGLLGRSAHFDTTTLQLSGAFNENDGDLLSDCPIPSYGYSKSKRHDLKQMVLTLATTGSAHFPIWMESHSGHASDKKVLPEAAQRMKNLCAQLDGVKDFLYVGDSAIYSNMLSFSSEMKWLSRVPETINEAKEKLHLPDSSLSWHSLGEGYSFTSFKSNYANQLQRWVMISSKKAYEREVKTLRRHIEKEKLLLDKAWWHLSKKQFSCFKDAEKEAKKESKNTKYHTINYTVVSVMGYQGAGRPKKDDKREVIGYQINFQIEENHEAVALIERRKGRFILATNEMDETILPDADLLKEYKAQSGAESGFKFIKDDAFELDSVFLKTPSRIDALMMVMTLCLMVYGVSQHDLREGLKKHNATLPNQCRKPTQKPTMKWIYFLFLGVHELTVDFQDVKKQMVINVTPLLKEILKYFGPRAHAIYLNPR